MLRERVAALEERVVTAEAAAAAASANAPSPAARVEPAPSLPNVPPNIQRLQRWTNSQKNIKYVPTPVGISRTLAAVIMVTLAGSPMTRAAAKGLWKSSSQGRHNMR